MKICLVRGELFHVDRRTDMTKVTVAFRNFANAPTNVLFVGNQTGHKQFTEQR